MFVPIELLLAAAAQMLGDVRRFDIHSRGHLGGGGSRVLSQVFGDLLAGYAAWARGRRDALTVEGGAGGEETIAPLLQLPALGFDLGEFRVDEASDPGSFASPWHRYLLVVMVMLA
jgi:hypothetical protein